MKKIKQYNPYTYLNGKQKIVFTLFLFLSIPFNLITQPASGMEASWRMGLNMALRQGLVWGRDVVFTYGPLSFLQTRLALYVSEVPIILFSVFVWINVMFIVFYFIRECKLLSLLDFFIAIVIVFMFHYVVKVEVSTTLIYIILFYLLYSLKYKNYFPVIIATITGSVAIFIKVTYFFPLIIIFGLYLVTIFLIHTGMNKQKILLIYGCNMLLIVLLCIFLNVDFWQYISASFHIVGAYNEAMIDTPSKESALTWLLKFIFPTATPFFLSGIILSLTFIITMPFLVITVYSLRAQHFHYISVLTALFCLFFLFLTFKYAFVRHGGLSYLYPPVLLYLLGLLTYFSSVTKKCARSFIYFICILLFVPSGLIVNKHIMERKTFTYYSLLQNVKSILRSESSDLHTKGNKLFTHSIPDSIKNKIGRQTVDIMPMEIALAYYNDLQYNPRPVIQSYQAYDAYLDNKNFNFYNSLKAPQFVIYTTNTIDTRYHFYDEPKTKFNLLRHYDFVDSFQNQLLLQRRAVDRISETLKREQQKILLNREYVVPAGKELQLSSFHIHYTALGSAIRFLYQSPLIQITFYLENGTTRTHRLAKTAVEVPVLINKYIADNRDFANLFLNTPDSLVTVRKIKIIAPEWAYKTSIDVSHEWTVLKDSTLK